MRKNKSNSIALGGILSALVVVLLLLGNLLQLFDLSMAALSGLIVLIAMIELSPKGALGVYAVSAFLAILISPQTASILFAAMVGYYPVAKVYLDKIKPKILCYAVKFIWFNLILAAIAFLMVRPLGMGEEFTALGKWFFLLCNFSFFIFDLLLEKFAIIYIAKIRPRLPFGRK